MRCIVARAGNRPTAVALVLSSLTAAYTAAAGPATSSPALPSECPAGRGSDAIDAAIRAAPSCRAAARIAAACAVGAGGDVALAGAVTEVCERDFLPALDRRGRATYARGQAACLAKYRTREGSMYRSAEAFCGSGVAERYSRRALDATPLR